MFCLLKQYPGNKSGNILVIHIFLVTSFFKGKTVIVFTSPNKLYSKKINCMKKLSVLFVLLFAAYSFQFCSSSKNAAATPSATTSFSKDVMPMMQASCSPCHFPPDGRKEPLNTLESVKANIDHVIERVKLPKDDRRFMPMMNKKPALTTEQIALLEKWKSEGMPE